MPSDLHMLSSGYMVIHTVDKKHVLLLHTAAYHAHLQACILNVMNVAESKDAPSDVRAHEADYTNIWYIAAALPNLLMR